MSELQRSAGFEMENAETPSVRGLSYILAIGIDDYQNCPRLYNAVKDVKEIVSILIERYQFDASRVVTLYNEEATRQNILCELEQMNTYVKPEDEVIILFSGHGTYAKNLDEGFWIPWEGGRSQDFDKDISIINHFFPKKRPPRNPSPISQAEMKVRHTYVSNRDVVTRISAIKSFHTLLIVDSCFAGSMFTERNKSVSRDFFQVPSRWLLTSGQMEPVSDGQEGKNSPFAEALIAYLKGSTRHITTSHFFHNLREVVILNTHKKQKPRYEPLTEVGHRGGEFEFRLKEQFPSPVIEDDDLHPILKTTQYVLSPYLLLFVGITVAFMIAIFMLNDPNQLKRDINNNEIEVAEDTIKKVEVAGEDSTMKYVATKDAKDDSNNTKPERINNPKPVSPNSPISNQSTTNTISKVPDETNNVVNSPEKPKHPIPDSFYIQLIANEVKDVDININGMRCVTTNGAKVLKVKIPKNKDKKDEYKVAFMHDRDLLCEPKDYQLEANPELEIPKGVMDRLKKHNDE